MKKTLGFKRAISLIVFVCFLTTNAQALPPQSPSLGTRPSGLEQSSKNILSLTVPSGLGNVVETYDAARHGTHKNRSESRFVIYIQDTHDSLEAQENIAEMIRYFVNEYGIRTVYEEGYEGPVPTDELFGRIKDPVLKEKISFYLMDKLRIGGAEYAHINRAVPRAPHSTSYASPMSAGRGADFELIGADSIALHLENIRAYEQSVKKRVNVTRDIRRIRKELQKLMDRDFPREIKKWLALKARYQGGKLPLIPYLERTWNVRRAEGERMRTGDVKSALRHPSLSVSEPFPVIQSLLFGNEAEIKRIDPVTLLKEIQRLEEEIVEQGLSTERDQKIYGYFQSTMLLEKLNSIQLNAEEYAVLKDSLESFKTEDVVRFVAREAHRSVVLFRSWEDLITDSIRFYEIAQLRDLAIEKILSQIAAPTPVPWSKEESGAVSPPPAFNAPFPKAKTETPVLVFGGFHKEAIKRILKEKGISYVILSPATGDPSKRHEDYYRLLMSGEAHSFEQRSGPGARSSFLVNTHPGESRGASPEECVGGTVLQSARPQTAFTMDYHHILSRLVESAALSRSERRSEFILEMDRAFTREQKTLSRTPGIASDPGPGASRIRAEHRSETRAPSFRVRSKGKTSTMDDGMRKKREGLVRTLHNRYANRFKKIKETVWLVVGDEKGGKRAGAAATMAVFYFIFDVFVTNLFIKPGLVGVAFYTGNPVLILVASGLTFVTGGIVRMIFYPLFKVIWPDILHLTRQGFLFNFIPLGPGNLSPVKWVFADVRLQDLMAIKEIDNITKILEKSIFEYSAGDDEKKRILLARSPEIAKAIWDYQQRFKPNYNYWRFKIRGVRGYDKQKIETLIAREDLSRSFPFLFLRKERILARLGIVSPGYRKGTRPILLIGVRGQFEGIQKYLEMIWKTPEERAAYLPRVFQLNVNGLADSLRKTKKVPSDFIKPMFKDLESAEQGPANFVKPDAAALRSEARSLAEGPKQTGDAEENEHNRGGTASPSFTLPLEGKVKFVIMTDVADVEAFTDKQLEEFEVMAYLQSDVRFVFTNDEKKALSREKRGKLQRMQSELGVHRIVITESEIGERVFNGREKVIRISKNQKNERKEGNKVKSYTPRPLSLAVRRKIFSFRYLDDETGLVPMALLYADQHEKPSEKGAMDFSMASATLREAIREFQNSVVFARAA